MFTEVIAQLEGNTSPPAIAIHAALTAPRTPASRSLRSWMQAHHGAHVHTVQVTVKTGAVWAPLDRLLDAQSHASYATLNGSRRDYAGMIVQSASADMVIVSDGWHAIAYIVA